jgi:hypothetical protein
MVIPIHRDAENSFLLHMITKTFFITFSPHSLEKFVITSFLLLCAQFLSDSSLLHHSAPSDPTVHLLPALYKAAKNAQQLYTHPEDGNCNI